MKVFVILLTYQLTVLPALSQSTTEGSGETDLWTAECGGKHPILQNSSVVLPPPVLEPRPANESLVFILLMSRTAVRICDELNNTVVTELNKTQSIINETGSSPIESLLPGKYPPKQKKVKQMLRNEINRLSRVGVFLELARNDTVDYKAKLTELERKVMEILCEMYQLMRILKAEAKTEVSRDIVTSENRDLDDLAKHKRNFFITRATRSIFQNLVDRLLVMTKMNIRKYRL